MVTTTGNVSPAGFFTFEMKQLIETLPENSKNGSKLRQQADNDKQDQFF